MDNKGINGAGIAHIWKKATLTFAKKEDLNNSSGDGVNSTFNVNAVGTLEVDLSTMAVTVKSITNADKTISEIIGAALSGEQVVLNVDVSASAKELFEIPLDIDFDGNIYFTLTTLNSLSETSFSTVSDLSGAGVPVCTRVSCDTENNWSVLSVPMLSGASDSTFLVSAYGSVSMIDGIISISVSSVSYTFEEIISAYNSGKNISLIADTNTGSRMHFCLVSVDSESINFTCSAHAGDSFMFIGVAINSDNSITVFNKIV